MITNIEGDLPPLLFVHIPKTGGIAIRSQLREQPWLRTWHIGHDPYHVLKLNNHITADVFKFSVVRNPFTRAYSYYDHFRRFNASSISFKNFLEMIERREVTDKTPLMRYDQSFYIFEDDKSEMDKIYRYEELWELEIDLNIRIPKINVGSYTKEEYNTDYDSEAISLVRKIYARDFRNLGYSDEFS